MLVVPRALRLSLIASVLVGMPPAAIGRTTQPPPSAPPARAAAEAIADRAPWLYRGSDIPQDPDWRFGTLANGLRYAVRRNGVPPGQVSVRVRIDAGSLMEEEGERGFAHLIEHLSFRGSQFVPDGQAKRIWQRLGATFGSDTNAETTQTETVYKLDLPSATEAGLDESLKILGGMVAHPNITRQALDAERPAVLAERREQAGPDVRLADATNALFFAGQRMADRSPIGHVETLEAATPQAVQAFHDRWYRPDRALVVIVGDLDPALFERLIAQRFGGWRGTGPAPAEPDFGAPAPAFPATAAIVEPGLSASIQMAVLRPWQHHADTIDFNQKRLVDLIAAAVINRRLEARARAGGSYVMARVVIDDPSRSVNGTFVQIVPVGADWAAALRDVRAVIADARAAPPSAAEIDRELAEQGVAFRTMVETARAQGGGTLADAMVDAVDIRETVTTPAAIERIFLDARRRGLFAPADVLAATRRIFQGVATRAIVSTQQAEDDAPARLAAGLAADVRGLAGARQAQAAVDFSSLPRLGRPAKVVSRERIAQYGLEKVVLSNGVRVMLYPTNSEADRVYVRVRFGRGYNALPADRATPAWAGDMALVASGIGKLRQGDIDQLSTGRRIGLDFGVDDDAFELSAITSRRDLPDQLRLIAAKLAAPAWDPNPVERAKTLALAGYAGFEASPEGVLTRDLAGLLRAGDPRWATPNRDEIRATTPASFRALWEPLLETGPVEVQVFGDIGAGDAIKAVARTIGALPPRAPDTRPAPPVRFPAHDAVPVVRTHDGPANQAAAVIAWPTGGGVEGVRDGRRLDVLAAIFGDRLFDRLRLEAGASYSPTVTSSWPVGLADGGRIVAIGQVAPANVPLFFRLARVIAADLVARPVSDDELRRAIDPMAQAVMRQSTGNQFWMIQFGGATYDPRRVAAFDGVLSDITRVTAADLQAVARRYLRPDRDWTLEVVPKALAGAAVAR